MLNIIALTGLSLQPPGIEIPSSPRIEIRGYRWLVR
jgi:hypothetical protein